MHATVARKWLVVAILVFVLMLAGCGGSETQQPEPEPMPEGLSEPEQIEWAIKARIGQGEYRKVQLDRIAVNENLGTEKDGDYIALIYLIFDVKNTRQTGNEVMRMYSDDLVATLAKQFSNIAEAVVFWQDDYNSRTVKYAYDYRDGAFYLMDKME